MRILTAPPHRLAGTQDGVEASCEPDASALSGVAYPQRPCGRVQAPAESHVREAGPVSMGDIYATIYKAFGIDWEKGVHEPGWAARQNRQCAR
jgi:hypothetical protein